MWSFTEVLFRNYEIVMVVMFCGTTRFSYLFNISLFYLYCTSSIALSIYTCICFLDKHNNNTEITKIFTTIKIFFGSKSKFQIFIYTMLFYNQPQLDTVPALVSVNEGNLLSACQTLTWSFSLVHLAI